ncbi:MAG: cell division protein FtsZ [Chitinophagaceae bacterium]
MIHFDLPKEKSSILKVIGVGGGGSNAVNHMFSQNIEGVNFIICNTDAQAIAQSHVPNKIQLGPHLTQGLGAGANPEIGKQATEESLEEIKRILEVNTKMAFITAGMGGGTGTGGAPIISKICKDLGILTVGIVTTPFAYEGKKRQLQAEEGIDQLKQYVDTLLVISNDKLRHQFGNLKMKDAFAKADNVLATAAKCITDVINSTGQINVDFADVCTVMRNGGVAILGSAVAEGDTRAQQAIEEALNSPLLNDNDIRGAKWILININSSEGDHEFTMDEVEVIQNYLLSHAGEDTDVILGLGYDNTLERKIGITLIATGFEHKTPFYKKPEIVPEPRKEEKVIMTLDAPAEEQRVFKQSVSPVEFKKQTAPHVERPRELKVKEEESPWARKVKPEERLREMNVKKEESSREIRVKQEESSRQIKAKQEESPLQTDALMPTLSETEPASRKPMVMFVEEEPVKTAKAEVMIERFLLAEPEPVQVVQELVKAPVAAQLPPEPAKPLQAEIIAKGEVVDPAYDKGTLFSKNPPNAVSPVSGGYLAKPANIYSEPVALQPVTLKQADDQPVQKEEEPILEMQLIIKEEVIAEDLPVSSDNNVPAPDALPLTD